MEMDADRCSGGFARSQFGLETLNFLETLNSF